MPAGLVLLARLASSLLKPNKNISPGKMGNPISGSVGTESGTGNQETFGSELAKLGILRNVR